MTTDFSVAPEIAQLASALVLTAPATAVPRTDGRIAGDLADLAATPERWWDLVRFSAHGPVRVPLPDAPGTWLLILPPGTTADCDCRQATALAGEATEEAPRPPSATAAAVSRPAGTRRPVTGPCPASPPAPASPPVPAGPAGTRGPLRPGRIRVHGTPAPHRIRAVGPGYSVSLHAGSEQNSF